MGPDEYIAQVVAGALFDFAGFLTTRDEPITASARHDATPWVDAIREFASMRGLDISDADVTGWSHPMAECLIECYLHDKAA